jgi:ATP-binding cassette subfamily F protein uup
LSPKLLLLDEPTNDLDIQTLSILEDYLEDFPGVVIAVSHDRYFLNRVVDKLLIFEGDGKIQHFVGNYGDYLEYLEKKALEAPVQKPELKEQPEQKRIKDKPLKLSFKEQRELDEIDGIIAGVEKELAEVKVKINQTGSNYILLQEMTGIQEKLEQRLEELMERWTYLNELVEEIAKNKTK